MSIDWDKFKPNPELDELSKSLVREIAEQFLNTGAGVPDHAKRVELGKHRHVLNSLVQGNFITNIGNKFYPGAVIRLPNGMLVPIPRADYHESWDYAKEKPKLILTRKYFQGYFPGHESAEEYFLPR